MCNKSQCYSDGMVGEVKIYAERNNITLTNEQIDEIAYNICHDDELNTLIDEAIQSTINELIKE